MKYSEMLFMDFGKEFDSSWVSKRMGQITAIILGWAMTISPYRHINIAFKQHKCKGAINAQMEQEVMSGIHALQSGHSVSTERRVYALDHDSIAGLSEDMITLYLDASTEYQKAFNIPPGGLSLPYHKVKMEDFVIEAPQSQPSSYSMPLVYPQPPTINLSPVLSMLKEMKETSEAQQQVLLTKINALENEVKAIKGMHFALTLYFWS